MAYTIKFNSDINFWQVHNELDTPLTSYNTQADAEWWCNENNIEYTVAE
jgi:hypothetical protein